MKVEALVRLERHWNEAGKPTEEARLFDVLISADVSNDEVGPVTVDDAPDLDMCRKDRIFSFAPLRGHELTVAQEEIWLEYLKRETAQHEQDKRLAWEAMAKQRAVEAVVQATLARVKLTRINPKAFLAALAAELGAA